MWMELCRSRATYMVGLRPAALVPVRSRIPCCTRTCALVSSAACAGGRTRIASSATCCSGLCSPGWCGSRPDMTVEQHVQTFQAFLQRPPQSTQHSPRLRAHAHAAPLTTPTPIPHPHHACRCRRSREAPCCLCARVRAAMPHALPSAAHECTPNAGGCARSHTRMRAHTVVVVAAAAVCVCVCARARACDHARS